jgi:hypothetical protein
MLGTRFGVGTYQESNAAINCVGLLTTQTDSGAYGAYGGALKYAKGLGTEKATFAFTGSKVGWVSGIIRVGVKRTCTWTGPRWPRSTCTRVPGRKRSAEHKYGCVRLGAENAPWRG